MAITDRIVATRGVELRVLDAGSGPPVVLAHGFPELSYSWRHQIPVLAEHGYRVLVPDQRGYGRSTCPPRVEDYDIECLTGDLLALLDDIGEERGVFVGHDWGAIVVWNLALLAPERVAGVVGISVPMMARPPMPPVQLLRQVLGDAFFYMVYFQEPDRPEADLGRNPATTMRRLLAARMPDGDAIDPSFMANDGRGFVDRIPEPDGLPAWLSQAELDHFTAEFTRTGFSGGINWYRNLDRNWTLTEHVDGHHVEAPAMFIGGSRDPVLMMSPPELARPLLDDDRGLVLVDGAGHWVHQEDPDAVNAALLTFLGGLDDERAH